VHNGGRIVYTSLGVPEDFKANNFRRMLNNAIFWTTHRDPERMKKQTHDQVRSLTGWRLFAGVSDRFQVRTQGASTTTRIPSPDV
jgi:type 1 glutamine amidotransferase